MLHLRLLRVLLAGLLLLLGGLVLRSIRPRSGVHSTAPPTDSGQPSVEGARVTEWKQGQKTSTGSFERLEGGEQGPLLIEGIADFEIQTPDRGPLIIDAARGDRGSSGEEQMSHFEEVTLRDPEKGLRLSMPKLYVDEAAGEARSSGDIHFEAPGLTGRASEVIYSLSGQPARLIDPVLDESLGGHLTAGQAVLLDGVDDIELSGAVHAQRPGSRMDAGRLRLRRDETGRLRHILAADTVSALWLLPPSQGELQGTRLEVDWDGAGQPERLRLEGDALIRRGAESIAARTLEAVRHRTGVWDIRAGDTVYVQGSFDGLPGLLRAERLEGRVDAAFALQAAEATGRVTFEGSATRAEAERATFETSPEGAQVRLFSGARRKARLADGRIRVAAERIATSPGGRWLTAEEGVEATLLAAAATGPRGNRLFAMNEAVHFVSSRLESRESGARLQFDGTVRGWQDQRNIAAERVLIDQQRRRLEARGSVCTRLPRVSSGPVVGEADYVQICADELDYEEATGRVDYRGAVHLTLAEGWIEARQIQVRLADSTGGIREVEATGDVQLECHETGSTERVGPISGKADRVVYQPAEQLLRLFGEDSPASVRRIGQGGGTTTGRVLRYWLERGTLEVDSEGGGPAQIRTTQG